MCAVASNRRARCIGPGSGAGLWRGVFITLSALLLVASPARGISIPPADSAAGGRIWVSGGDTPERATGALPDGPASASELFADAPPALPPCGPASMAVAFKILGAEIVNDELAALADDNGESNFSILAEYARSKGLYTEALELKTEQLPSVRNVAILQVRPLVEGRRMHFVVFAGPADDASVYVFDAVATYGLRGPVRLDRLADKFTGKALIMSKYPIDLSGLKDAAGPKAGRLRTWSTVSIAAGATLLLVGLFVQRLRRLRPRHASVKGIVLAILVAWILSPVRGAPAESKTTKPPRATESKTQAGSRYLIGPPTYRAGAVSVGTRLHHEFEIRNTDKKTIKIRLGKTSCSCLGAEVLGPNSIPPGRKSTVAVDVLAAKGGGVTHGVLLHISGVAEPVYLAIAATVKDDTTIAPGRVDFGAVSRASASELRPVRIVHHTDANSPFAIVQTRLEAPFLRIAEASKKPTVSKTADGVIKCRYTLNVILDPCSAPVGRFAERLSITAIKGKTPLTFDMPCTGNILPLVVCRPGRIFKMRKNIENTERLSVRLQSTKAGKVTVESVEGDAGRIMSWRQQRSGEAGQVVLTLEFEPAIKNGRTNGTFRIRLKEPFGEVVTLPVLLIQKSTPPKDPNRPDL